MKQFYSRCGVLWSGRYFVSTAGHTSEATVKKYIEEQKNHD
ncbi:transposase [Sharpea porci]